MISKKRKGDKYEMIKTKKLSALIMMMALLFGLCGIAQAANTANQTVLYQVTDINAISVSGNPGTLIMNAATAGALPDAVSDSSTSYSVTTNGTTKKITAKIDSAMPTDLALKVFLTAPNVSGASAIGAVLTTAEADVVTGIGPVVASDLTIRYELHPAGTTPPTPTSGTKTVTFTLTDQ